MMDQMIKVECINIDRHETKMLLKRMDSNISFQSSRLVYYPYFFFEYMIEKTRFSNKEKAGCTIDSLNGLGALTDTWPNCREEQVKIEQSIIPAKLNDEEARHTSEKFLSDTILRKRKVLSMPRLRLTGQVNFYRPYWVVECESRESLFTLVVDAVSGRYHPL